MVKSHSRKLSSRIAARFSDAHTHIYFRTCNYFHCNGARFINGESTEREGVERWRKVSAKRKTEKEREKKSRRDIESSPDARRQKLQE